MSEKDFILYKYVGIPYSASKSKRKKRPKKGYILSSDEITAKTILKTKKKISVVKLTEVPKFNIKFTSVSGKDISLFFEGFSKMISAGISISMAVDNLINSQYNLKMIHFLYMLKHYLEEGKSLPDAMSLTKFFPYDVIEMIKVGDASGKITQVLDNLVVYYNQKAAIKKAVTSATMFPAIMLVVAFLILVYLAPKMIEPMMELFDGFENVDFPAITLMVLGMVQFIKANLILILSSTVATVLTTIHQYKNNHKFKRIVDTILINAPITGQFIVKLSNYKFIMVLEILYNAGIPIERALIMIEKSEANVVMKDNYKDMIGYISNGGDFSTAVNDSEYMVDMGKSLIEIGERTGKLDSILKDLSRILQEEFDLFTKKLNKMMTPISTLFIGGIIGTIIIAVYMPIISMMDIAANAG